MATGAASQSNYELAGGSLLEMSGHARRIPEASIHPAQCLTVTRVTRCLPCHAIIRLAPQVHKVAVRAANAFNLNHLRSLSW